MSIWSLAHPDTPLQCPVCGLSEYPSCPQAQSWPLARPSVPLFSLLSLSRWAGSQIQTSVTLGSVLGVNPSEDRLACYMLLGLSVIKPDAHMLLFQQLPEI